jgi:hypothetical protein
MLLNQIARAGWALLLVCCAEPQAEAPPVERTPGPPAESAAAAPVTTPAVVPQRNTTDSAWTVGTTRAKRNVSGVATLAAIRVAQQDSFDRFVLEFAGPELPSYHIEYVDRPIRQCGSGDVVPVAGDAWLLIRLEPARAHDDQGRVTLEQRRAKPGLPILLEALLICDFEAQVEWVLGVSSPLGYRVSELTQPARLVIDLRTRRRAGQRRKRVRPRRCP